MLKLMTFIMATIISTFLFFGNGFISSLFTNIPTVRSLHQGIIGDTMPILFMIDSLQVMEVGIIRGLYPSKLTTLGGFIGYFLIAVPVGCILCFVYN
jgi:Na+-driven multidrug efflux pump